MNAEQLLKKLDAERDAYLAILQKLHEALARIVIVSNASTAAPPTLLPAWPVFDRLSQCSISESDRKDVAPLPSFHKNSIITGEEEELSDDDKEALYVQDILPAVTFNNEHLKTHLKSYE